MTLKQIKGLRIISPEEEELVQSVVDEINHKNPVKPKIEVYDLDIKGAEVKTPEEEARLQAELDKRISEAKVYMGEDIISETVEETVEETAEKQVSDVKCELCGSRGYRHRKRCPKLDGENKA